MHNQPQHSESRVMSPLGQQCLQALMRIWFRFERDLNKVPIIQRLERNQFSVSDYQNLLLHLRQQVIEGSRWISRSASSFDRDFADVRSVVISHAKEEHKDYEILEQDFINIGGQKNDIQMGKRNVGTEALHGFLMYRASQTNPVDMIGAMWIIEGLGQKMAASWAEQIEAQLSSKSASVNFMRYHGANDDSHLEKLYDLLDRVCKSQKNIDDICRTAAVVARLYTLQLEEIDHD